MNILAEKLQMDMTIIYTPVHGMEANSPQNFSDSGNLGITMDSNFARLLFSLIFGMVWVTYITYYNSRVIAYIVTRLLTRFYVTKGYLSIGKCLIIFICNKKTKVFKLDIH